MPDIHSVFADPILGYVVFIGLKFLPDPWDKLNYFLDYENDESVKCNDILKDKRNIGFMPQYMLVITCPLSDSVRTKKQFQGTLRSSENKTHENITICTSGVSVEKRQFLSMCTMVRNVDSFIPDWLDFHRYIGVEHVYIYDNEEAHVTTLPTTLKDYIADGYVTVIPWHHSTSPMKTYLEVQIAHENDCIWRHKYDVEWMIKIDVDEYIQPMDPKRPLLTDYLKDPSYKRLSAIRMSNWFSDIRNRYVRKAQLLSTETCGAQKSRLCRIQGMIKTYYDQSTCIILKFIMLKWVRTLYQLTHMMS